MSIEKSKIFRLQCCANRRFPYKKCKYNIIDSDVFVDKSKVELPGRCLIVDTEPCNN